MVRFLVNRGIPSERVSGTGHAGRHPVDSRGGSEAQQRKRRVEPGLAKR
jgi:outer membrane protein OmpA-like peptidoglycan-associated protein